MKNEDLSELDLPSGGDIVINFFGEGGVSTDSKKAIAKSVECSYDHETVNTNYYIMVGRGEALDPYQADFGYTKQKLSGMYKYRKVSKKCFTSYMKYLQTKNRTHFTTARRLLMEN